MENGTSMKRQRSWLIRSIAAGWLVLDLALGGYASAAGEDGRTITQQKAARAKSKADHEALADAYEQEAKALDAKAAEHEALAKTYAKLGNLRNKPGLIAHCASLVDQYRAAAKETRELAQVHRELAEGAADIRP